MTMLVTLAFVAGVLVSLSRQINGRLALSTSALQSSFWNHIVGFAALVAVGLVFGGLWPAGVASAPAYAFIGGSLGVVFIAARSSRGSNTDRLSVTPCQSSEITATARARSPA